METLENRHTGTDIVDLNDLGDKEFNSTQLFCIGQMPLQMRDYTGQLEFEFTCFGNMLVAIELLKHSQACVVLLNQGSGIANILALEKIKREIPACRNSFVALIGEHSADAVTHYDAGFDDVIRVETCAPEFISKLKALTRKQLERARLYRMLEAKNSVHDPDEQSEDIWSRYYLSLSQSLLHGAERVSFDQHCGRLLSAYSSGAAVRKSMADERDFITAMCQSLVDSNISSQAWVGLLENDNSSNIKVVAFAGAKDDQDAVPLLCKEHASGCEIVHQVLESGKECLKMDMLANPACQPCWQYAQSHHYDSVYAFPLPIDESVIGLLTVNLEHSQSITEEEKSFLRNYACDLAQGVEVLRARHNKKSLAARLAGLDAYLEAGIHRRTQELELSNKKLQELDKLKSLFIASVSHELRTPMNSILGFSGVLLQEMSGSLNSSQRGQLTRVYTSAQQLLNLIVNVLDVAKLEGGDATVLTQEFDLVTLVQEVVAEFSVQSVKSGIPVKLNIPASLTMVSDKRRVSQIVRNIISNAFKYSEKGLIQVSLRSMDDSVEFAVRDEGIGISSDELEQCFHAFERLSSHLKVRAGGAGIGLYLVKKIVEQLLKGEIVVESQPGVGSCFTVVLPRLLKAQLALS